MLSWAGSRSVCALACLLSATLFSQEKKAEEKMVVEGPKADEVPAGVTPRLPAITSIHPSDGRPGSTVEFGVRGEFLDGADRIEFESPDVKGKVIAADFTTVRVRVSIDANAEPGQRYFRLFSPRGATNLLVFRLTKWPEFTEVPADGSLEK